MVLFLWKEFWQFSFLNPTIAHLCRRILKWIAPTNYDKAHVLLMSQCDQGSMVPRNDTD
jgi:hypothetical protein